MSLICKSGGKECSGCGQCMEEETARVYCDKCGSAIYCGETYYRINGQALCEECIEEYREVCE